MPFEIEIDVGRALVIVVVTGVISDEDLIGGTEYLRGHRDFRPDFDQLVVGTEVERVDVTREGVAKLAAGVPLFSGVSRRAIVAQTPVGFGMSRMFELSTDGRAGEINVFQSEPEALEWLGLAPANR
jgi:hypothetical protein